MTTTRTINWRDLVRAVDPDYDKERSEPVVYEFPGHPKRDPKPT